VKTLSRIGLVIKFLFFVLTGLVSLLLGLALCTWVVRDTIGTWGHEPWWHIFGYLGAATLLFCVSVPFLSEMAEDCDKADRARTAAREQGRAS